MPNDESSSVPTVFCVVNFNTVVEQVEGGGSANTTHMMAFQEMTPETKTNDSKVQIQRTKRRKSVGNEFKSTHANINPKRNPPSLGLSGEGFKDNSNTYLKYFMWLLLRKIHGINEFNTSNDQVIPYFSDKIFVCLFLCHEYLLSASH